MRHEATDRVPVMCQLALGHYFLHSQRSPADIWFDSTVFAETLVEFQKRYRFDGILINLPGRPPDWRDYVKAVSQTDTGSELHWRNGLLTRVPADDNPQTLLSDGGALPRANPDTVDPEDPAGYRLPGFVWNTWHAPHLFDVADDADLANADAYPSWFSLALRQTRKLAPDVSVHVEVFSPFTMLMELFGYEQCLMALLDKPETCHKLLEVFTAHARSMIANLLPHEPDAVLISSAFAGAGFVSQAMYREFVVPYERSVAQFVKAAAVPVYVHTCGAIGDRLGLMSESGLDGVDTLDPPPLGTVDLASAKSEFGSRFFFKGNLDAVNEMLRADDQAFEQAVKQRIEIGQQGSGYILSSACSVAPHVKPERLRLMVELAERYSR
jgi:hypothetical protein